jgi:RNA polymerase sigma factor (sigma-70 family)
MGFVEFHNANDALIWDKFREGNANAFEIIYERNIRVLANYGRRMCPDDEMVKDAIQDMFVDVWRNRANLGSTNSIKYYLIKAYRRNLIKKINAAKRFEEHKESSSYFDGSFQHSHDFAIVEAEMEEEQLFQLNALIEALPTRQKEALFLRFYGGLNYTEISETMGINQQSAHNMVFRALGALRNKMTYHFALLTLILNLIWS